MVRWPVMVCDDGVSEPGLAKKLWALIVLWIEILLNVPSFQRLVRAWCQEFVGLVLLKALSINGFVWYLYFVIERVDSIVGKQIWLELYWFVLGLVLRNNLRLLVVLVIDLGFIVPHAWACQVLSFYEFLVHFLVMINGYVRCLKSVKFHAFYVSLRVINGLVFIKAYCQIESLQIRQLRQLVKHLLLAVEKTEFTGFWDSDVAEGFFLLANVIECFNFLSFLCTASCHWDWLVVIRLCMNERLGFVWWLNLDCLTCLFILELLHLDEVFLLLSEDLG